MERKLGIAVAVVLCAQVVLTAWGFNLDQQATNDQVSNALSHGVEPGYVTPPPPGTR